jgi:hypothetical protein
MSPQKEPDDARWSANMAFLLIYAVARFPIAFLRTGMGRRYWRIGSCFGSAALLYVLSIAASLILSSNGIFGLALLAFTGMCAFHIIEARRHQHEKKHTRFAGHSHLAPLFPFLSEYSFQLWCEPLITLIAGGLLSVVDNLTGCFVQFSAFCLWALQWWQHSQFMDRVDDAYDARIEQEVLQAAVEQRQMPEDTYGLPYAHLLVQQVQSPAVSGRNLDDTIAGLSPALQALFHRGGSVETGADPNPDEPVNAPTDDSSTPPPPKRGPGRPKKPATVHEPVSETGGQ